MGYYKSLLDRKDTYGFTTLGDKTVCGVCFGDYALKDYIKQNVVASYCNYCNEEDEKGSMIAADIDEVLEYIISSIKYEWGNPDDEGVGYNSREGGYIGAEVYDGWEFVRDILSDEAEIENEVLLEDITDALSDSIWCKLNPYNLSESDELFFTWKEFSEQVKHKTRYVFYKTESRLVEEGLLYNPYEILDFIGHNIEKLNLLKIVTELDIFRVRISSEGEYFLKAKEIGTPSVECALSSNRMSPAGIPMFYGAIDEVTALEEVEYRPGPMVVASIGQFSNTSDLLLLDLTCLPSVPSIFDESNREKRWIIKFFRSFLNDFTKPVEKDGHEHIEYVPTQIVTEYLRQVYRTSQNSHINGIIYPSSKNGKKAFVLFFNNDDCIDEGEIENKLILKKVYHK